MKMCPYAATGIDITYPENPKYVRGRNYPSGVLCFPVSGYVSYVLYQQTVSRSYFLCREPNKARVVYIIHTFLGGRIPSRLADPALLSLQLSFFSSLTKAVKEVSP